MKGYYRGLSYSFSTWWCFDQKKYIFIVCQNTSNYCYTKIYTQLLNYNSLVEIIEKWCNWSIIKFEEHQLRNKIEKISLIIMTLTLLISPPFSAGRHGLLSKQMLTRICTNDEMKQENILSPFFYFLSFSGKTLSARLTCTLGTICPLATYSVFQN